MNESDGAPVLIEPVNQRDKVIIVSQRIHQILSECTFRVFILVALLKVDQ